MNQAQFADGIYFNLPSRNAPEFIIGDIAINRDQFMNWLQAQPDKLRLSVKIAKSGKPYVAVNDWQPNSQQPPQQGYPNRQATNRQATNIPQGHPMQPQQQDFDANWDDFKSEPTNNDPF